MQHPAARRASHAYSAAALGVSQARAARSAARSSSTCRCSADWTAASSRCLIFPRSRAQPRGADEPGRAGPGCCGRARRGSCCCTRGSPPPAPTAPPTHASVRGKLRRRRSRRRLCRSAPPACAARAP
eukprot:2709752-Prymnesium_polylepis.1